MSQQLTRSLVRYRWGLVAIANAAATWVVLIIAPLGLFAVITCTGLVFAISLATGFLGDVALLALLEAARLEQVGAVRDRISVNRPPAQSALDTPVQRELPKRPEQ